MRRQTSINFNDTSFYMASLRDHFVINFSTISAVVYLLYVSALFGIFFVNTIYVHYFNFFVQLAIAAFLIHTFMPNANKTFVLTHYEAKIVFTAGCLLSLNLLSNIIVYFYDDLRNMLKLSFLPTNPPVQLTPPRIPISEWVKS